MRKYTMFICLCLANVAILYGQVIGKKHPVLSRTVYFQLDQSTIDPTFADNKAGLQMLSTLFANPICLAAIDSIHIYAYSSPEGGRAYNEKLAEHRAEAMKHYLLQQYPRLVRTPVRLFPSGENWEGFRELVACDKNFKEREEVLMILDKVPDSDKRDRLLKYLNEGRAFEYMKEHHLAKLRNATVCTIWVNGILADYLAGKLTPGKAKSPTIHHQLNIASISPLPLVKQEFATPRYFSLKTNLASWVASTFNLSCEVQTGTHTSLDLPLMWSSWDVSRRHALRIIAFQPELRYWLTRPGGGHFFGLHAHAARYNLKWGDTRYQDTRHPLIGAGVSYGYQLPVNKTWGLEFNIGAGYAHTRYNTYYNVPNGASFDTRVLNYWGITRIGLSLIYKLNVKKQQP